jgi:predicted PurR-regulated permease PerM
MGKIMNLSPAIILLSLSVWGYLFGIIGLIIALPMTTLAVAYYKRYIIGGQNAAEATNSPTEEAPKA